jgi:hypothetical protein
MFVILALGVVAPSSIAARLKSVIILNKDQIVSTVGEPAGIQNARTT